MTFYRPARGAALLVICCAILLAHNSQAQSISGYSITDYETLEWLFETGQIDSDEFERWDEYFTDSLRQYRDSDTVRHADELDLDLTEGRSERSRRSLVSYRIYHRGDEDRPYRQLLHLRSDSKSGLYGRITVERYPERTAYIRARHVGWTDGRTGLQLGGIDPVWCGGLVAGRHPYFLKYKEPTTSPMYSMRDRFNGVLVDHILGDVSLSAFSSFDRDSAFTASAYGARVSLSRQSWHLEAAAVGGRISNRQSGRSKRIGAFGLEAGCRVYELKATADVAFDGGGNIAYLGQLSGQSGRSRVSVWHYDNTFLNPFGAGRANTDTREVSVDEIDLTYRSRFAGETGVEAVSRLSLGHSHRLAFESDWWKSGVSEKYRLKGTYRCSIADRYGIRLMALTGDDSLQTIGYSIWSAVVGFDADVSTTNRYSFSGRTGSRRASSGRERLLWIDARWSRHSARHRSIFLLRYFDPSRDRIRDHYLYCSASESYTLDCGLEFSLKITTRFGPEQDAIEKTRITIESEWRL